MEQKNYIATLQELLQGRNEDFDRSKHIALIRHADNRKEKQIFDKTYKGSLLDLYRADRELFIAYQSGQEKGRFEKEEFVVTTLGINSTLARFLAVYRVKSVKPDPADPDKFVILDLEEMPEFNMLSERIVFDWGKAAVSWKQDYRKQIKYVQAIDEGLYSDKGYPYFKSYADTLLTFPELKAIFENEDPEWKSKLTAVNCIYLIQDRQNGKSYVGSTYNAKGIWNRWKEYVETEGHGNNVGLKAELQADANYAEKNLQWSILEIFQIGWPEMQAIERETLYKRKLASYEPLGYNKN